MFKICLACKKKTEHPPIENKLEITHHVCEGECTISFDIWSGSQIPDDLETFHKRRISRIAPVVNFADWLCEEEGGP